MLVRFVCCVCRTPLGRIDTDTLHLPYTTDQFKPLRTGANQPFPDVLLSPRDWWCPQCMKRPIENERVYTDQGWVWAKKAEEVPVVEEKAVEPAVEGWVCDVCGKVVSSKIALIGHKRSHK